ncbi:MAG: hypothetical protein ACSNEK_05680 [Parachlamydiaceae bacterium]
MKIHGIPDSKVPSLLIKSHKVCKNKAEWAFHNLKAVINRIYYDIKCRVWITNKKLADWSVTKLERSNLTAQERNSLNKTCALALKHLSDHAKQQPLVPGGPTLQQRYEDAQRNQFARSSEDEDASETASHSESESELNDAENGPEEDHEPRQQDSSGSGNLPWNRTATKTNRTSSDDDLPKHMNDNKSDQSDAIQKDHVLRDPEDQGAARPQPWQSGTEVEQVKEPDLPEEGNWPGSRTASTKQRDEESEITSDADPSLDAGSRQVSQEATIDLRGEFEDVIDRLDREIGSARFANNPHQLAALILDLPSHLTYSLNEEQRSKLGQLKKKLFDHFPQHLVSNFERDYPELRSQLPEALQSPTGSPEDRLAAFLADNSDEEPIDQITSQTPAAAEEEMGSEKNDEQPLDQTIAQRPMVVDEEEASEIVADNNDEQQVERPIIHDFLNFNVDQLEAFLLEILAQPQESNELRSIIVQLPLEKVERLIQRRDQLRAIFLQFHPEYANARIENMVRKNKRNLAQTRRAPRQVALRLNFFNEINKELDEILQNVPSVKDHPSYVHLDGLSREMQKRFNARQFVTTAKRVLQDLKIRRRRLPLAQLETWVSELKKIEQLNFSPTEVRRLIKAFEHILSTTRPTEEEELGDSIPGTYVYKETNAFIARLRADYTNTVNEISTHLYEELHKDLRFLYGEDLVVNFEAQKVIVKDPNLLLSVFEQALKRFPAVFQNAQSPEEQALASSIIQSALVGKKIPPTSPFALGVEVPNSEHPLSLENITFLDYLIGNDNTKDRFIEGFITLFVKDNIDRKGEIRVGDKKFLSTDKDSNKNWAAVFKLIRKQFLANLQTDRISEELQRYAVPPFNFFTSDNPLLEALDSHGLAIEDEKQSRIYEIFAASDLDARDKEKVQDLSQADLDRLRRLIQLKFLEVLMVLNQKVGGHLYDNAKETLMGDNDFIKIGDDAYYELDQNTLKINYKQEAFFKDRDTAEHLAKTEMSLSIPSLFSPVSDVKEDFTQGKLFVSFYHRSLVMELFARATSRTPKVMALEATIEELHQVIQANHQESDYIEKLQNNLITLQAGFASINYENPAKLRLLKNDLRQALKILEEMREGLIEENEFVSLTDSLKISDGIEKVEELLDLVHNINDRVSRDLDLNDEWTLVASEDQEALSEEAARQPTSGLMGSVPIRNLNEFREDGDVNKVKASKYDHLLTNLANSLNKLDSIPYSLQDARVRESLDRVRQASRLVKAEGDEAKLTIDYLTQVRDGFELIALEALRNAIELCEQTDVSNEIKELTYLTAFNLYSANDMSKASDALLSMLTQYDTDQRQSSTPPSTSSAQPGFFGRIGTWLRGAQGASSVRKTDRTTPERESVKKYQHEFVEELHQVTEKVSQAPASLTTSAINRGARSIKDHFSLNFSPIGAGNPTQKMGALKWARRDRDQEINIIGMGSPTLQPWMVAITKQQAVIDPLFRGYLYHLEKGSLSHLYVSLQNISNDENLRNSAIMQLQMKSPSLYAITLAKNSHFYEGHGPDNAAQFCAELHKQFFELDPRKSGCYISEKIKGQIGRMKGRSLEETSKEMIKLIHEEVFDLESTLDHTQRRVFIEIYYNLLVTHILSTLDIDYVNFTCKDGIDRGMGALASFEYLWMIMENKELDPASQQRLKETINLRAYWVRKRAIIKERSDRVYETMDWLLTRFKTEENKVKFQNLVRHVIPEVQATQLLSPSHSTKDNDVI